MHITALCPFCRSTYQVDATLRGQLVRCPNATCRKVFPVPTEEAGTTAPAASKPPSPGNGQRAGSVGDMVPMLPAETATPPQPGATSKHVSEMLPVAPATPASENRPADGDWWQSAPPVRSPAERGNERQPPAAPASEPPPSDAAWWRDAPPPVRNRQAPSAPAPATAPAAPTQRLRTPARPPGETQPMPALGPEKSDPTRELSPGAWEPPPVRRSQPSQEQTTQPAEEAPANEAPRVPFSKRHYRLLIGIGFGLALLFLGGTALIVVAKIRQSEGNLAEEAYGYYKQGSFGPAEKEFQNLAQRFPNSEHHDEYRFMDGWSGVSRAVSEDEDLPAVAVQFAQFVEEHKKDDRMREVAHDAGQRLLHLANALASRFANPTDDQPLKAADSIEQLRRTVMSLSADALTRNEMAQIDDAVSRVRKAVELARKRRDVLAQVKMRDKETPMEAIKRANTLLMRMERELPGIKAEARPPLLQLEEAHFASVVYFEAKDAPPPPPAPPVDEGETMRFAPLVAPAWVGNAPADDPIVEALVRGVLYALKKSTGDLKWAVRVGPDTTVLPQRVEESAFCPELLLVMSADTQTLSALNVEGKSLWKYHVGQPVLGRPVIIERRAYLADYSGWVHEIELSEGQLLGRWFLGQPLTRGGAREGETNRIYFPADDSCIYVLDVGPNTRRCVTILYDDHPSGSLRSEPVVIPPEGDNAPGFLILNQSSGLDAMQLRVFELPLQDRHAVPLILNPPARLDGWTWFEPKEDGEKLAVLSDAGILGLFGIRQLGNNDPALFPLLAPGGLDLSPFLSNTGEGRAARGEKKPIALATSIERGRAQVVHMQDKDLWVLAHGGFQQVRLGWNDAKGPQAGSVWKAPLMLGSPLHDPQRREERNDQSTFFLVTQALQQQTCLATAVDEAGQIKWQRQLGLVCQGQPLALTPPGGGSPLLLALDRGGGLFVLDPELPLDNLRYVRQSLAPALADNPLFPPYLLAAADGHSAYEIAAPGDGHELIVRHIEWINGARELRSTERRPVSLLDARGREVLTPACPPIVAGSQLLLAMSDDNVMALSLTDDKAQLRTGPSWREKRTPFLAPCHTLALGGDRFLTTNGNRSLSVYEWPAGKDVYDRLPKDADSLKPLEHLVAAPPVLLPSANGQPPRVAVVDSAGMLRLFVVKEADGSLQPDRTWKLDGNLTAGPFAQATPEGWRIGCVLDRRRLRWIDPTQAKPLWTFASDGPAILGPPQRIEDMLVLALQSGRYVGIDPKTGKRLGRGYTLRTSAAPAATPMAFGPGRMFAPLSDGTALLLSVKLLK